MSKINYKCDNCDAEYMQKYGKCRKCGEYGTLQPFTPTPDSTTQNPTRIVKKLKKLSELTTTTKKRFLTGISELDRVLGGGFVEAEVVLFGGAPGAGKSTLSLMIANSFAQNNLKVLYSSGEESEQQIKIRADRLNINNDNIQLVNETLLEDLTQHINNYQPDFVIIDSLQTLASEESKGNIGSVSQSKQAAHVLTNIAKTKNIRMLMINQLIKTGDFSGSEAIQHIVDCALMLESSNDTPLKFLRCHKNRFGTIDEVGVFQHENNGLMEVTNPSGILLENNSEESIGAACGFSSEGLRQIPVEVQALVARSAIPTPRKQFNGVDYQRAQIVCAILDKFCRASLHDKDVFIATVSGMRIKDPLSDLAIAASVLSSSLNKKIKTGTIFIGELSLTGQVRGNFLIENKIKEAERLGFNTVIIPSTAKKHVKTKHNITIKYIKYASELLKFLGE